MSRKGPLANSYWSAVALVIFALTPFLVLTSAVSSLDELMGKDVHLSMAGLEMTTGMANAAYCFGTVLAIQLTTRLPERRLLIVFITTFILSSVLAGWAPTPGLYVTGRVLQGLMTAMMLIAAVPPLIIGWPKQRMRTTAMTMNLAIFGAVALGPVVGGVAGGLESWRTVFWIIAGIGFAALVMVLLTFEEEPPSDPEAPIDVVSLSLAGGGTAALFFGAAQLTSHAFTEVIAIVPMIGGVFAIIALILHQSSVEDPLIPIRKLAHTIPYAAILVAMCAAAASVGLVTIAQSALEAKKVDPIHGAMLFWPEFGGAVAMAVVFGLIFFTRLVPLLALAGMAVLGGGGCVLTGVSTGSDALVVIGSGAVGVGVGASVAPALFTTAFTLPSPELPRVFALIELLRGAAAFAVGPILAHIALTTGSTPAIGSQTAIWVSIGLAFIGAIVAAAIWITGKARLQRPDIEAWLEGEKPAIESPAVTGGGEKRRKQQEAGQAQEAEQQDGAGQEREPSSSTA